jgi:hypothetical protein
MIRVALRSLTGPSLILHRQNLKQYHRQRGIASEEQLDIILVTRDSLAQLARHLGCGQMALMDLSWVYYIWCMCVGEFFEGAPTQSGSCANFRVLYSTEVLNGRCDDCPRLATAVLVLVHSEAALSLRLVMVNVQLSRSHLLPFEGDSLDPD